MSQTAHRLHRYPQIIDVIEPKAKRVRPPKHARIAVKLDTVMGVAREMGRLIRLSYNGHLAPEELTRYVFALDKLRSCLESAAIEAKEAAQANAEHSPMNLSIVSVPEGHFMQADGSFQPLVSGARLQLAAPLASAEPPTDDQVDNINLIEPPSAAESEEEARIIDNLKNEINALARKAGITVDV